MSAPIERWREGESCCDPEWEAAYRRFETPEEETAKFRARLVSVGAERWPRDAAIAELFCGRGNGLRALAGLGFTDLRGVDLSGELLASYDGPARLYLGDCRDLYFAERSLDVVIVQGGLHHLPDPVVDLERTLDGVRRVLRPEGRLVVVEPWLTPFLRVVHAACDFAPARRAWGKLDALAAMIERERDTYFRWLARPREIRAALRARFLPQLERAAWGKLTFVGAPRAAGESGGAP